MKRVKKILAVLLAVCLLLVLIPTADPTDGVSASVVPLRKMIVQPYLYLYNTYFVQWFTQRAVGQYGEVWVCDNIQYQSGDPRNPVVVTDEEIQYLLSEFDRIYPTVVGQLGEPDSHDGSKNTYLTPGYLMPQDGVERVILLVTQSIDKSHRGADPNGYNVPSWWALMSESMTDRNIIGIDPDNWEEWLGGDDAAWRNGNVGEYRPNYVESAMVRALSRLITTDKKPEEASWVHEGLGGLQSKRVGYSQLQTDFFIDAFMDEPTNSLVLLNENLAARGPGNPADTGACYLLFSYLQQRLGEGFTAAVLNASKNGIEGLDEAVSYLGYEDRFMKLYNDWVVALAINSKKPANKYYFEGLNRTASFTDGIPGLLNPWTPYYRWLDPEPRITDITANGVDYLNSPWTSAVGPMQPGNLALYSGGYDLADLGMYTAVNLTAVSEATLNFRSYWNIEGTWDFGFVQVSTDNGETWTSLSNGSTSSIYHPRAYLGIIANLPGFTGYSGGWTNQAFDLGPYCGQSILLGFRYMTDWGTLGHTNTQPKNWYVDDIAITAAGISNTGETLLPFGTLARAKGDPLDYLFGFAAEKKKGAPYKVGTLNYLEFTSDDGTSIEEFLHDSSLARILMIAGFAAPDGITDPVSLELVIHRAVQVSPK